jgi:ectoine hydroxylase-related dioxygenase (phytanoyl-CoA dioxygenase family)
MWMAVGSQHEPIYPPHDGYGYGDRQLGDIQTVGGVSNPNDHENDLAKLLIKYPQVLVEAKAGDVVFFHSHVLHRSKKNFSTDRYRRSFVSHYATRVRSRSGAATSPSTILMPRTASIP